jgi:signal transduction histidine kinase
VRHELAWLLVAVVGLLGYYVAADLVPGLLVLAPVAPVVLPAAILAGVLLHGMYDVDRLLVRTLVAACLTALVLGASLLIALLAGAAVDTDRRVTWAAIVTGVVAVGFAPVRQRSRRVVNRLVHGHDDDPLASLQRVGDRLALALPAEDAVRVVVDAVAAELRPSYVALDLLRDGQVVRSARTGDPDARGEDVLLPVHHGGDRVAELVVRPRPGGLDPPGRRVLVQLVRSCAPALHAALLAEQLQRSREQLVLAREEERRRIRRDLHDGLGAVLTGLSMSVAALEQSEPTSERRDQLLRVGTRLDDARAEVRRLLDDLRPRDLDELGLAEALRVVAEQFGGPATAPQGVRVDVDVVEALGALGADVEVAAYRIVSEALSNAVRHGGADRVQVRVQHDGDLLVEVRDDGTGLGPDDVPGVGLASMHQRATELGGSCVVRNDDERGTLVRAVLPVQR